LIDGSEIVGFVAQTVAEVAADVMVPQPKLKKRWSRTIWTAVVILLLVGVGLVWTFAA
jgi:hypothetical protein